MKSRKIRCYVLFMVIWLLQSVVFAAVVNSSDMLSNVPHLVLKELDSYDKVSVFEFNGTLMKAVSWQDKLGRNVLLFTEQKSIATEPNGPVDSVYSKIELFVYHYREVNGLAELHRQIYDYMSGCRVQPESGFVFDSLSVTDVDGNGIGEASFVYRLLCGREHRDGSQVKLMMLEDGRKYALRGEGRMQKKSQPSGTGAGSSPDSKQVWDYIVDEAFTSAPPAFLKFSQSCWAQFGTP